MTTRAGRAHIPPVATVVDAIERPRVDAAGAGLYRAIHRDTVRELVRDLKERKISAVLLSVGRAVREEPTNMAAVLRDFPRIPTLALLSGTGDANAEDVLALGNYGVRTLVDVREPAGWGRLRHLLGREAIGDTDRAALATLRRDLAGIPDDCWEFFEALFAVQDQPPTVREFAQRLKVLPSTLMSRFFRGRLPPPKRYLAFARLIRAARLFENPGLSIADVANHLEYSSPQSFGRHVRTLLLMTAGQFRSNYDGERMFELFRQALILPHLARLRVLHPLHMHPGGCGASSRRGRAKRPNGHVVPAGRSLRTQLRENL